MPQLLEDLQIKFCVSSVSPQSWSGGYQRLERWRLTLRKTPRNKLKTSWCHQSDVQFPREKTVVQRMRTIKKNSCVGAENLTFNIGLKSRVVMATQSCLETLRWRESGLWPWCWIISWTSLQGKARQESHSTELWKKTTHFKHFFYCYVITVSPNVHVHFSLIELNFTSHLCQNNLSSFSLILKMFWMVTRVTDERTFPVLFWVCGLNAVPPVWCKCVHQGRFVLRESHVWKQEDTQQPQFQLEFTIWKQSLMFLCGKDLSETPVPPSSRDKWLLFCEAWFTFSPSFSFYNIPSGRPRIFCHWEEKRHCQWQIEGNHWSNWCNWQHYK